MISFVGWIFTRVDKNIVMLTFKIIEKNIDLIKEAIHDFQNDARLLVEKLALLHGLEIEKKFPMNTFIKIKNQSQHGILDEKWLYFFHGHECRFKNIETGHTIEVMLKFEDEYGAVDPYFLGKYIKTNPKYIDFEISDEFNYGLKIIRFLQKREMLLEIENHAQVIIGFEGDKPLYESIDFKGIKLK
jgi:hypothetical protein